VTEIRFYHVQNRAVNDVLPPLLNKALEGGHKIVVRTADGHSIKALDDQLWTYRPDSFLPHGTKGGNHPECQTVYITDENDNPAEADVLVVMPGASAENAGEYALCCEMLNGRDNGQVTAARERWKTYKDAEYTVTYWQQSEAGGWDKKA
jgi:DNA polymerase-3 subunit chi